MTAIWFVLLLIPVALLVSFPFWKRGEVTETENPELAALEAAREAKYREIRDAEIDHKSGKLSDDDFAILDADLRREALEILDELESLNGSDPEKD